MGGLTPLPLPRGCPRTQVHNASGPRCPWCAASDSTVWLTSDGFHVFLILAAWAAVASRRSLRARRTRFLAAAAAYPAAGFLIAAGFFAFTDYPYFAGFTIAARAAKYGL